MPAESRRSIERDTSARASRSRPPCSPGTDKPDLPALAARAWPVLHRLGPLFLGSLRFHAVPAAAATLRAIELLRAIYESGGQKWPPSLPTSFLRPAWREAVVGAETANRRRRIWEAATLL